MAPLPSSMSFVQTGAIRVRNGRHGLIAFSIHDSFVGRSIDLYGEWSPDDTRVLGRFAKPGMTALDIGANIGVHTIFLAQAAGPSGRVLAFEPVQALFDLLCCNLTLNALGNAEACRVAMGRMAGRAVVPHLDLSQDGNFGAAALDTTEMGEEVEITTVDALQLDRCDLIKADVEGMEGDVIAGAAATIARCRPVLFVENEIPEKSSALIDRLVELGYALFWHSPPLFVPDNYYGNPVDAFPGLGSLNLLALPEERAAEAVGLKPVAGADDWPQWWPNWSAQDSTA